MKRKQKRYSILLAFIFFCVISIVSTADAKIVCNKFNLVTKVAVSTLDLSLDTDLSDNFKIWVSVRRSYYEIGSSSRYSVDYFSKGSTVGEWRSTHEISLDNKKWKSDLRALQQKMSGYGAGFAVASISEKINISIILTDSREDQITGKAVKVRTNGSRYIEDEIEINYPLDSPPLGKSNLPSLNPENLDVGQIYILSKQTPLMPSYNPADPIAALQKMKQIPKGGALKVIKKINYKNTPWYKVVALDQGRLQIGIGWINSTALFGQQLKTYK